jgi:hypothetical protein
MYTITIERLVTMKHTICYAYPTSDLANKVGKHGYVVNDAHQFDLYEDALSYAQTLGTDPDRWSIDHPANSTFLQDAQRLKAYHSRNKVTV